MPLSVTCVVPPVVELLLTVKVPAAAPVAVGSNCTLSITDWFGFNVTGKVAPESLKPVPCNAAELIMTGAVPDEVSVSERVAVEPTGTLPNDSEVALNSNCGVVVTTVPVPLNWTTVVAPLDELLLIVNCPDAAPAAVGLNFTWSVTD